MEAFFQIDTLVIGLTLATIFILILVALARHDARS